MIRYDTMKRPKRIFPSNTDHTKKAKKMNILSEKKVLTQQEKNEPILIKN